MATGSVILHDKFTGTAGTGLESHTPTDTDAYSSGWDVFSGTPSNVELDGSGNLQVLVTSLLAWKGPTNATLPDSETDSIQHAWITAGGTSTTWVMACRRHDDGSGTTQYFVRLTTSAGPTGTLDLLEQPGGKVRGTYVIPSFSTSTEYKISLECVGNVIKVFVTDVAQITYTATKSITGATKANPCQITCTGHDRDTGAEVDISGVGGMTELNGNSYRITKVDANNFTLDGVDSTGYGTYTSGGTAAFPGAGEEMYMYVSGSSATSFKLNEYQWQYDTYTIPSPVVVTPSTVTASSTVPSPTIAGGVAITPSPLTATATIEDPAVNIILITPATFALTATIPAPILTLPSIVNVTSATATVAIPDPDVLGKLVLIAGHEFPTSTASSLVEYKIEDGDNLTTLQDWTTVEVIESVRGDGKSTYYAKTSLIAQDTQAIVHWRYSSDGVTYTKYASEEFNIYDSYMINVRSKVNIIPSIEDDVDALFTTGLTEAYPVDGQSSVTVTQLLYSINQALTEFDRTGNTVSVKQRDGTEAYELTLDNAANPSSATQSS